MAAPTPVVNTEVINTAAKSPRSCHQPFSVDVSVLAASDGTPELVAAQTNYTIYVTHISVSTTTDNAATLTFQDDASTPLVIAKTKASPGLGQQLWDFGEQGTALTVSKALDMAISAAGLAARVHVEGYRKLTGVGAPA